MEQSHPCAPAATRQRTTSQQRRAQRRRKRRLRLLRNWALFLTGCAAVIGLVTTGVFWLLPKAYALVAGGESFEAKAYDGSGYSFDANDARLLLVNGNVPFSSEPSPSLAVADDATGVRLESEAAEAYRSMAAAALADGIELVLEAGYQDASARQAAYDEQLRLFTEKGYSAEEAAARAQAATPIAACNEHGTGYAADIVSADHTAADTAFAKTRAYEWLSAYAAEYGFILRRPEDQQAATGMEFEPWHWRYVGAENALAIRASGLSLEEFLALELAQ